jgi:hypothetical protein
MSRKLFVTLILILFLLPFVSWYYLRQGLNYRKEAQALMNGTGQAPIGAWMDNRGRQFSSDQFSDKVSLITLVACDGSHAEVLDQFYEQFRETGKTNFILLDTCKNMKSTVDTARVNWYVFSNSDSSSLITAFLKTWPDGKDHALVDRHQIVRSYYTSKTTDEKRLMLEHMALLLPRDRSDKVELKRGNR